jgi:hypothetical protein
MKRLRDKEDDDLGNYNPHKQWEHGNEEEEEEEEEVEEEEEEEVEPPFPPHPPMYGGITWESIEESLSSARNSLVTSTLHSTCASWRDITGISKRNFILVQMKSMNPMKCWNRSFLLKTS